MPKFNLALGGMHSKAPGKRAAIAAIQNGEPFLYGLTTRQGAVKIGISTNIGLRLGNIGYGGTDRLLAFRPGDRTEEQAIHNQLAPYALPYEREYYYPTNEVMEVVMEIAAHFPLYRPESSDFPDLHEIAEVVELIVASRQSA